MTRRVRAGIAGGTTVSGLQTFTTTITSAADLDIIIDPSGAGRFLIDGPSQLENRNPIRFGTTSSANFVALRGPATAVSNITWTLPNADGANAQVLTTDGAGNLSWTTKSVSLENNTTDSNLNYPLFTTSTSGDVTSVRITSSRLDFQPSTGRLRLLGNVSSTTTTTGSLVVTGGVGISENLNVGGVLTANTITGVSGYIPQNTATTLADLDRKYIVSNTSAITLTLPATSTDGRTIVIVDGNNFGSFNVTLARNGNTILGGTTNLVLNVGGSKVELVYRGGDWKVFAI
jgi:hypothetical protein